MEEVKAEDVYEEVSDQEQVAEEEVSNSEDESE